MKHQNFNSIITFNDLATTVLIRLNIHEGNELIVALGYPNTYTNQAAIKHWIKDHYKSYAHLQRQDLVHSMCKSILMQVHEHFEVDLLTMH